MVSDARPVWMHPGVESTRAGSARGGTALAGSAPGGTLQRNDSQDHPAAPPASSAPPAGTGPPASSSRPASPGEHSSTRTTTWNMDPTEHRARGALYSKAGVGSSLVRGGRIIRQARIMTLLRSPNPGSRLCALLDGRRQGPPHASLTHCGGAAGPGQRPCWMPRSTTGSEGDSKGTATAADGGSASTAGGGTTGSMRCAPASRLRPRRTAGTRPRTATRPPAPAYGA